MQLTQKWLTQKTNQSVLLLLVGGLLLRGAIAFYLYPSYDEAYYYLYTLHLDWSYFDHPLFVALTTGFGTWLTGDVSQFTIRLGTLILHTGSLIFLYLTSLRLFSVRAAILTLAIASITPVFQLAFGTFNLPDCPLMFFWSASLYCAANEFFRKSSASYLADGISNLMNHQNTKDTKERKKEEKIDSFRLGSEYIPSYRLAILSILVGLACLSKYHGFILGFGLVGFCLTSRYRAVFRSPWTWLGLGLFFVTISPMLFWNIQHDWVSFRFQSERAVPKSGYNLLSVLVVCLAGMAYLFPTMGFPLWKVSLQATIGQIKQFSKTSRGDLELKQQFILWVSLPLIVGFTLIGGYRQILPAWTMPGFWGTTLLLGQQAEIWEKQQRHKVRGWLLGSQIAIATLLLVLLLQVTTGIFQKPGQSALLGGFVSPKDDPSATELIDIQQLRQGFANSPIFKEALQKSSFIFTNRYYLGGPIAMSLKPISEIPITCFDIGNDLRGFAFWSKPNQWLGKDALYVTTEAFISRTDLMASYRNHFDSLNEIETISIRRGGEVVNVIHIYQAKNLLKPYPRAYGI